jgi:SAM-dependent methyltransferase
MSTQYSAIQAPYDCIRKKSIAIIEHENVQTTVAPFINNARVLDLACGSGFYSYDFLKWGASAVVGVDISPVMIEEARRQGSAVASSPSSTNGTIDFILADCAKPTCYAGGPFDLVFGAWLLNYAPDRTGLVDMFRNISLNLKDGGHFVSVTVPPAQDPTASVNAESNARPPPEGSGGLVYHILQDVEDGIYFHAHADTEVGDVDFDCYHLRKDVYEAAAREAGMRGELKWGVTSVPERYLRGEGPGGASMEELESYQKVPNYGLLVVAK